MNTLLTNQAPSPGAAAHTREPARLPHPAKTPRIQHVMDEFGERIVVLFPCERCSGTQHYSVLHKAPSCFRCDGVAPGRNDSTAA